LIVLGAGGHAKVVVAAAQSAGLAIAGIFDDDMGKNATVLLGHAVTAPIPRTAGQAGEGVHLAIGTNRTRQRLASQMTCRWQTIVHRTAFVHPSAEIASGAFICTNVVVHPDARIGAHAIVNTAAIVEHDCRVGAFVHLAPLSCLAGGAEVGDGTFIGAGAVVIPGIRIGAWVTIGAGAVVVNDIPDGATAVGVPARTNGCA
jgi:sugar O-acyltransferase (sialic acid O-acetyltransferase NeuD family)